MVREQRKETESIEIRIEEVMYRYLDMILEKNPNAVITCDEIGCGIVPIDKTDRLWAGDEWGRLPVSGGAGGEGMPRCLRDPDGFKGR